MARRDRRAHAFTLALAFATAGLAAGSRPAPAQGLPRLHVTALGLHADRTVVHPGESFHVTVRVVVSERDVPLERAVILPALTDLDDLGDERRTTRTPAGTEFLEVLTLAARAPGTALLTPAYLDAIDARTGRPSRFSSNALRIRVLDAPGTSLTERVLHGLLRALLIGVACLAGALVPAGLVWAMLRRRRMPTPPVPAPPPVAEPPRADRLALALSAFGASGSDHDRLAVRAALLARAGVADGATLADALARTRGAGLRGALLAAERAAFGPARERAAADAELIAAAHALLGAT